jgi:hypothetical protein
MLPSLMPGIANVLLLLVGVGMMPPSARRNMFDVASHVIMKCMSWSMFYALLQQSTTVCYHCSCAKIVAEKIKYAYACVSLLRAVCRNLSGLYVLPVPFGSCCVCHSKATACRLRVIFILDSHEANCSTPGLA